MLAICILVEKTQFIRASIRGVSFVELSESVSDHVRTDEPLSIRVTNMPPQ